MTKKKTVTRGGRKGFLKRLGVKKAVKRVGRVVRKKAKKVVKEGIRRGIMAGRRAADYAIRPVPYVGNAYALADLGVRGARAKRQGKLGSFIAKEGAMGLAETLAPQAMATYKYNKAKKGVRDALLFGKGEARMIVRRGRRNM